MIGVRLLRGRVIIRPTGDSSGYDERFARAGLVMPATFAFDPRKDRGNQNTLGRGVVVAMGAPAFDKRGNEVAPDFKVGDEVLHIGQHQSRNVVHGDGTLRACAQEEVCAVLEPEPSASGIADALADTDPPPADVEMMHMLGRLRA